MLAVTTAVSSSLPRLHTIVKGINEDKNSVGRRSHLLSPWCRPWQKAQGDDEHPPIPSAPWWLPNGNLGAPKGHLNVAVRWQLLVRAGLFLRVLKLDRSQCLQQQDTFLYRIYLEDLGSHFALILAPHLVDWFIRDVFASHLLGCSVPSWGSSCSVECWPLGSNKWHSYSQTLSIDSWMPCSVHGISIIKPWSIVGLTGWTIIAPKLALIRSCEDL